jgi:sorbose reductase
MHLSQQPNTHSTTAMGSTPAKTLPDSVMKMFDMTDRVAIVTGGSGGIGYEAARALAEAGCNVTPPFPPPQITLHPFRSSSISLTIPQIALWYNSASGTDKLASTIEKDFGVKAKAYKCAVENWEEVRDQTSAVVRDFGRLDVMIANAGISIPAGNFTLLSSPFIICFESFK